MPQRTAKPKPAIPTKSNQKPNYNLIYHKECAANHTAAHFFLEVSLIYIYPENLTAKATLWLWELRDVAVIGVGLLLSVLAIAQVGLIVPLVLTFLYAFLSIRVEDASILDFLRNAANFLFLKQQFYEWRERYE